MAQHRNPEQGSKGRPRNRAPPPPPGVKVQGGKGVASKEGKKGGKAEGTREEAKEEVREGEEERQEREPEREREEREQEEVREDEHTYSSLRRGEYINWEYEQEPNSDDEDPYSHYKVPRPNKRSNPPTIPLNTHPVLKKSNSQSCITESRGGEGEGTQPGAKHPKNRAPPPPPNQGRPPRGLLHQMSTPTPLPGDRRSGDVGLLVPSHPKPPPGHKRTKSDQPPFQREQQQNQQHNLQQRQRKQQQQQQQPPSPQQKRKPRGMAEQNHHSPVLLRRGGRATPPLAKARPPSYPKANERPGKAEVNRSPLGITKRKAQTEEEEGRGRSRDPQQGNIRRQDSSDRVEGSPLAKPKRSAPPPPPAGAGGNMETSSDQEESREREGERERERRRVSLQGAELTATERQTLEVRVDTPPPKPQRLHRRTTPTVDEGSGSEGSQGSSSNLPRSSSVEEKQNGKRAPDHVWERLLHKMEFFTITLNKDGDRSLGMVIVSGKVRNKDGGTVEGIFIQKILAGSLTDKDGRIQAGDMLVEINEVSMVGGTVDLASKALREAKDSVRLKVGRPDHTVFRIPGGDDEPLYVNNMDSPGMTDVKVKLEEAEARVLELEGLKDKAEKDLKLFREMADKEQKNFHKQLEEMAQKHEAYKTETQSKISDLSVALANITLEKTKLDKEVESLKSQQAPDSSSRSDEEITALKRQLKEAEGERDMAERDLQQLRQEAEGSSGLQSRLKELESDLKQSQQDKETTKRQLESTCHELSVAQATLGQMQLENAALVEEKERLELEVNKERKPSAGRLTVEAELAQRKRALSSAQRDLLQSKDVKEKLEKELGEVREALQKEKERNAQLEERMEAQKKADKVNASDLLNRLQSQAKQMHDLKEELAFLKARKSERADSKEEWVVLESPRREGEPGKMDRDEKRGKGEREEEDEKEERPASREDQRVSTPDVQLVNSPAHAEGSLTASPKNTPDHGRGGKDEEREEGREKEEEEGVEPRATLEESITLEAFDAVKALPTLDTTSALHKKDVISQARQRRKKPSREHIRSMSVENLLGDLPFPSNTDENKGEGDKTSPMDKTPVPRPRKQSMDKDNVIKPHPVPRHRSPGPMEPPLRPPKPRSPHEAGAKPSPERKKPLAPKVEPYGGKVSPPNMRPPSPKTQPPPSKKNIPPPIEEGEPSVPPSPSREGLPPKPAPRKRMQVKGSAEDPTLEELQSKDPSMLTVKEKRMLAQKAMERKVPPVLPKRPLVPRQHGDTDAAPKTLLQVEGDEDQLPGTRYSCDPEASPRHVRKLPPGAFNIAIPTVSPMRVRSNTVATEDPRSREHSLERDNDEYRQQMQREAEADRGSREALDTVAMEPKPRRPPPPLKKRASDEKPVPTTPKHNHEDATHVSAIAEDTGELAETDSGPNPLLQAGEHGTLPDPAALDYDQVLVWTPAQVASWVTRIGLSQHAKVFLDRGVWGNKLFDLDLKGMGITSHDDRAVMKREIRALRPHAEKQKKLIEKQRKEEKKEDKKRKKKQQFV